MSSDLDTTVAYADFIVELKKAKDRIEKLEAALKDITSECRTYCFDECCEPMKDCRMFNARAALAGEKKDD